MRPTRRTTCGDRRDHGRQRFGPRAGSSACAREHRHHRLERGRIDIGGDARHHPARHPNQQWRSGNRGSLPRSGRPCHLDEPRGTPTPSRALLAQGVSPPSKRTGRDPMLSREPGLRNPAAIARAQQRGHLPGSRRRPSRRVPAHPRSLRDSTAALPDGDGRTLTGRTPAARSARAVCATRSWSDANGVTSAASAVANFVNCSAT